MKKNYLFLILTLSFIQVGIAQSKVTRYCAVSVRVISYLKIKTEFSTGEVDSLFKFTDSTESSVLKENIPTIHTLPDLLNFMAEHKWKLFTISSGIWCPYIFKREFNVSEIKK